MGAERASFGRGRAAWVILVCALAGCGDVPADDVDSGGGAHDAVPPLETVSSTDALPPNDGEAPVGVVRVVSEQGAEFISESLAPLLTDIAMNQWETPPVASRSYALVAIALYEGLVAYMPEHRSLSGQLIELEPIPAPDDGAMHDPLIVASAAVDTVLRDMWRGDYLEAVRYQRLDERRARVLEHAEDAGVSGAVVTASLARGELVGERLVRWIASDGFDVVRSRPFLAPSRPGAWVRTGALRKPPVEPHWGEMRPFVVRPDECPAPAHVPYDEDSGSAFYREAYEAYERRSRASEEERLVVLHWADEPTQSYLPPGHWIVLTLDLVRERRLALGHAAEVLVRVAVAIADGMIACWRTKYDTYLLRPETFIRAHLDPNFRPMIVTPPFPAYTSGHAVLSFAAARTLEHQGLTGPLVDRTGVPFGRSERSYSSPGKAAAEAAESRVLGGIHYPMDARGGIVQGECVASQVGARLVTRRAR